MSVLWHTESIHLVDFVNVSVLVEILWGFVESFGHSYLIRGLIDSQIEFAV